MFDRVHITFLICLLILLIIVLELVRRKKFREEYCLLWIVTVVVLLILTLWKGSLKLIAGALGILYPPSALFVVGSMFILAILLHFSAVISSFKTKNQELAQRFAILNLRLEKLEKKMSECGQDDRAPKVEDNSGKVEQNDS